MAPGQVSDVLAVILPHDFLIVPHAPEGDQPKFRLPNDNLRSQCFTNRHTPVNQADAPPSFIFMSRPPSLESVRTVLSDVVPNVTIQSIQQASSTRLVRCLDVRVADGRRFVLILPPSLTVRLLRAEQWLVLSEALVLRWLSMSHLYHRSAQSRTPQLSLLENQVTSPAFMSPVVAQSERAEEAAVPPVADFFKYIPTLVATSMASEELGCAFNVVLPPQGIPIASLGTPFTESERKILDYQKGWLIRHISELKSPNSRFGPIVAVIGQSPGPNLSASVVGSGGVATWSEAFLSQMEGILRDGEDLTVMLSYSLIRIHVQRLRHYLDAVTHARLVNLEAGCDMNLLVERCAGEVAGGAIEGRRPEGYEATTTTNPGASALEEKEKEEDADDEYRGRSGVSGSGEDNHNNQIPQPSSIAITGIQDWSNCVFGDPLFAPIFSQNPSQDFLRGFHNQPASAASSSNSSAASTLGIELDINSSSVIQDPENAHIRLLLYECYHAVVSVVREFYRPTSDSTRREEAARRRLASVLRKLDDVEEGSRR